MSDKEMDAIQRLPNSESMREIRERVEFLAAIKEGEDSLDRGLGFPQAKVEKLFENWIAEWRSRP